eukprot:886203-Pyramimonas_sp.AAC.1
MSPNRQDGGLACARSSSRHPMSFSIAAMCSGCLQEHPVRHDIARANMHNAVPGASMPENAVLYVTFENLSTMLVSIMRSPSFSSPWPWRRLRPRRRADPVGLSTSCLASNDIRNVGHSNNCFSTACERSPFGSGMGIGWASTGVGP